MRITISGPPGSGKTTVGRLLAEKLGVEFISTGMIFRQMAEERGVSLAEFGELALKDHGIDKELDKRMIALAKEKRDVVLEGRLAGHMLHLNGIKALKVWIDATVQTRANRISGREKKTPEQVSQEITVREQCERQRYKDIYGIDMGSLAVYDDVIQSDDMTPEDIVAQIMGNMEAKASV